MENHESARRQWGGGIMGAKAQMKIHKKQKALEAATKI
jgi:large subunit ribosomal protein L7Ae